MIPAGFLETLRDNPEDDTTRLVLADWFDDHDDPVRAEFIRLGVMLAHLGPSHPERAACESRYQSLLHSHQLTWLGGRPASLERWTFRGGLVDGLVFRGYPKMSEVEPLLQRHPVTG